MGECNGREWERLGNETGRQQWERMGNAKEGGGELEPRRCFGVVRKTSQPGTLIISSFSSLRCIFRSSMTTMSAPRVSNISWGERSVSFSTLFSMAEAGEGGEVRRSGKGELEGRAVEGRVKGGESRQGWEELVGGSPGRLASL